MKFKSGLADFLWTSIRKLEPVIIILLFLLFFFIYKLQKKIGQHPMALTDRSYRRFINSARCWAIGNVRTRYAVLSHALLDVSPGVTVNVSTTIVFNTGKKKKKRNKCMSLVSLRFPRTWKIFGALAGRINLANKLRRFVICLPR